MEERFAKSGKVVKKTPLIKADVMLCNYHNLSIQEKNFRFCWLL